jgi:hypothetical protein
MGRCPKCNSSDFVDTARREYCRRCSYEFYYGDAHAQGGAQISKEVNPGKDLPRLPDPKESNKYDHDLFDDQYFLNGY